MASRESPEDLWSGVGGRLPSLLTTTPSVEYDDDAGGCGVVLLKLLPSLVPGNGLSLPLSLSLSRVYRRRLLFPLSCPICLRENSQEGDRAREQACSRARPPSGELQVRARGGKAACFRLCGASTALPTPRDEISVALRRANFASCHCHPSFLVVFLTSCLPEMSLPNLLFGLDLSSLHSGWMMGPCTRGVA